MNCVFISPNHPRTHWMFTNRLKANGVNVLGIGDCPYDELNDNVRDSLTEYYYVQEIKDYNQVFRAVAFFSFKYGKIDWLESNNEFWLEQDARLRSDFNITTGVKEDEIGYYKRKSLMKGCYKKAKVPSARQIKITTIEEALAFIKQVGYPVIVKPDIGVSAYATYKLSDEDAVRGFFADHVELPYVMEEYVEGNIFSYDAILDNQGKPLMEACTQWPPSIMNVVADKLDLAYYVRADVPDKLKKAAVATINGFGVKSRFVHLEFFCLTKDKKCLGKKGDFVGLEVNMSPAEGYTPDLINYAHSIDVYKIWADMVTYNKRTDSGSQESMFCVYAGRRDQFNYVHTPAEISKKYGNDMIMAERMSPAMVPQMGNQCYIVKLKTEKEVKEFIKFVTERR